MDFKGLFFFKQKTAYEMRISDWSSDVCSSDLQPMIERGIGEAIEQRIGIGRKILPRRGLDRRSGFIAHQPFDERTNLGIGDGLMDMFMAAAEPDIGEGRMRAVEHSQFRRLIRRNVRSEEHTSELQSLMRNSYAVFCLKKKKQYIKKIKH